MYNSLFLKMYRFLCAPTQIHIKIHLVFKVAGSSYREKNKEMILSGKMASFYAFAGSTVLGGVCCITAQHKSLSIFVVVHILWSTLLYPWYLFFINQGLF